jgi:hypothetical protein
MQLPLFSLRKMAASMNKNMSYEIFLQLINAVHASEVLIMAWVGRGVCALTYITSVKFLMAYSGPRFSDNGLSCALS